MKDLIDRINSTFLTRTEDLSLQREIWRDLANQFRPEISQYRTARPSTLIARETGDMGLAVLWIVESMLVRPILKDISLAADITENISGILSTVGTDSICALANSENPAEPVVYEERNGKIIFSGEKKFITAGANADLIIVTCRRPGEEKVSGVALVGRKSLPEGSLIDLNLNIFRSVSHTKLIINGFQPDNEIIPALDPSVLRRSLKRWGIIERALIMESFISFLIYAGRLFASKNIIIPETEKLMDIQDLQTESANKQLDEALYGKIVETKNADAAGVFSIIGRFKEKFSEHNEKFSEEERIKLSDLSLFDNLKG